MKKSLLLIPALALVFGIFAGCSGKANPETPADLSPEERSNLYAEAIKNAQGDENGNPVMTPEDDVPELMYEFLGFQATDAEAFAMSVSLVNIKAYGIVLVKPVAGKEETVKTGLQTFIDNQRQAFENYLPDQYAIAKDARLETLKDGTLVMVMSSDSDAVFDSISANVNGK